MSGAELPVAALLIVLAGPPAHGPLMLVCTLVTFAGVLVQRAAVRPAKPPKPTNPARTAS
ncbi:hypothetical protein JHN63_34315 [Streptomyces sp. MBT65]|uniref:hypothetical protein n=1 Tax=Streptomyces sp. MBT65 TaxID=1488395 RepID=UPI00190A1D4A|nr:hypothetical protein [Streptomyces sp. MBT65]MBK3578787.1 hypothetical protein [Streptomyces sp. MBT65]